MRQGAKETLRVFLSQQLGGNKCNGEINLNKM